MISDEKRIDNKGHSSQSANTCRAINLVKEQRIPPSDFKTGTAAHHELLIKLSKKNYF